MRSIDQSMQRPKPADAECGYCRDFDDRKAMTLIYDPMALSLCDRAERGEWGMGAVTRNVVAGVPHP